MARTITLLILAAAGTYVLLPLWMPLTLSAWVAGLGYPYVRRFAHSQDTKSRVAAAMTTVLLLVVLTPLAYTVATLAAAVVRFTRQLMQSDSWLTALRAATTRNGDVSAQPLNDVHDLSVAHIVSLLHDYGQGAMAVAGAIAGATTRTAIYAVVFVLGTYVFLAYGKRTYEWLAQRMPLRRPLCDRLGAAFIETGRGLFLGIGLTALLQGLVAGIGYAVLGIPQAAVLGFLTGVAALIPSVGTPLVWIPVSASLFLSDRSAAAVVMLVIGLAIATTDNLVRPWLSRYGRLDLPAFAVFVAMLGGLLAFGPGGLILGPLMVRLAVESLNIYREQDGVSALIVASTNDAVVSEAPVSAADQGRGPLLRPTTSTSTS